MTGWAPSVRSHDEAVRQHPQREETPMSAPDSRSAMPSATGDGARQTPNIPLIPGAIARPLLTALLGFAAATATAEEHRLGALYRPAPFIPAKAYTPQAGIALPASVDLSAQLPPIGDQGAFGSCV